jgi:hypothetical protein
MWAAVAFPGISLFYLMVWEVLGSQFVVGLCVCVCILEGVIVDNVAGH